MYYITTPIYYVNDVPHIGHAYTTLLCDALARFKRLDNYQVKFLTGTDEHGKKIERAAMKNNSSCQSFVDRISVNFRKLSEKLCCSCDDFIRTTEQRHKRAVYALWQSIYNSGYIYRDSYKGWYAERDETFYQQVELIDNKAPTGAEVEWLEEESYFFKLSALQDRLLAFYANNPDFVTPQEKFNEVISFVRSGLKDLSISRISVKWGIPVPGNSSHTIYVWLDALTNYLSAVNFPDTEYLKYWQSFVLHVIGKDILRFHAVYWPAFLMAADLPLPHRIAVHGWWTNEGHKISKSLGNTIDPFALIDEFGIDKVRYFLLREIPFGNDGDFSRKALIIRTNTELVNNISNLIYRTLTLVHKYCNGRVPVNNLPLSIEVLQGYAAIETIRTHIEKQALHKALEQILSLAARGNEYIHQQAPWELYKDKQIDLLHSTLYNLLELIRCLGILLQAFIPIAADEILTQLAISENKRMFVHLTQEHMLKTQTVLPPPKQIFTRLNM